jgi:hypothetical protein
MKRPSCAAKSIDTDKNNRSHKSLTVVERLLHP